jgi:hypothetical protein
MIPDRINEQRAHRRYQSTVGAALWMATSIYGCGNQASSPPARVFHTGCGMNQATLTALMRWLKLRAGNSRRAASYSAQTMLRCEGHTTANFSVKRSGGIFSFSPGRYFSFATTKRTLRFQLS